MNKCEWKEGQCCFKSITGMCTLNWHELCPHKGINMDGSLKEEE